MSVPTAYRVKIELEGLGEAEGELVRIYAPRTVEALVRAMPLRARAYPADGYVYFQVPLSMGVEKPRREVEEGALAYWPQARAVCIYLKKLKVRQEVSLLGKVTMNLDVFKGVKVGTPILVEMVEKL